MLYLTCRLWNLWGSWEGRVVGNWVSQAIVLNCTVEQYGTPPIAYVAPNGYKGTRPASTSAEDNDRAIVHTEVEIWWS